MVFKRGDIIYFDLGHHPNSKLQSGIRPCVVMSNNRMNNKSSIICVVPCTSNMKRRDIPTNILLEPEHVRGFLKTKTLILTDQYRAIDKRSCDHKLGHIKEESGIMEKIEAAIITNMSGENS